MCAERIRDPDVVIVGSGIAGALMAKVLATGGRKVLILEAGEAVPPDINSYMNRFLMAKAKVPESPYLPELFNEKGDLTDPATVNVGRPTVLSLGAKSRFGDFSDPHQSYLVQNGPLAFASTYERVNGGTSPHSLSAASTWSTGPGFPDFFHAATACRSAPRPCASSIEASGDCCSFALSTCRNWSASKERVATSTGDSVVWSSTRSPSVT